MMQSCSWPGGDLVVGRGGLVGLWRQWRGQLLLLLGRYQQGVSVDQVTRRAAHGIRTVIGGPFMVIFHLAQNRHEMLPTGICGRSRHDIFSERKFELVILKTRLLRLRKI